MSPVANSVVDQALALPVPERAEVAAIILESICQEDAPPLSGAWMEEIRARITAIDEGTVECIPLDEALMKLRDRLK